MKPLPHLVIDASIARAAGSQGATFPVSKHCRDFLETVQTMNYPVVLPPPLLDEWRRNASTSARMWLVAMLSKPQSLRDEVPERTRLRRKIARVAVAGINDEMEVQAIQMALQKDFHLLEAALATGKRVASLDDKVRFHFRRATSQVKAIKAIVWVNPGAEGATAIVWLEKNAKAERKRMLDCEPAAILE